MKTRTVVKIEALVSRLRAIEDAAAVHAAAHRRWHALDRAACAAIVAALRPGDRVTWRAGHAPTVRRGRVVRSVRHAP